jgi:hypothetical protein
MRNMFPLTPEAPTLPAAGFIVRTAIDGRTLWRYFHQTSNRKPDVTFELTDCYGVFYARDLLDD